MANWRSTKEYEEWHTAVIKRDGVCQSCGIGPDEVTLHAHHIKDGSYHPDDRYNVDNGITLCGATDNNRGCHCALHTSLKSSYRQKTTDKDLYNFLELSEMFLGRFCNEK